MAFERVWDLTRRTAIEPAEVQAQFDRIRAEDIQFTHLHLEPGGMGGFQATVAKLRYQGGSELTLWAPLPMNRHAFLGFLLETQQTHDLLQEQRLQKATPPPETGPGVKRIPRRGWLKLKKNPRTMPRQLCRLYDYPLRQTYLYVKEGE